jgi:hypothetical protein
VMPGNSDCPICLDSIQTEGMSLKCGNRIHISCFQQYLRHKDSPMQCPLCKAGFTNSDLRKADFQYKDLLEMWIPTP